MSYGSLNPVMPAPLETGNAQLTIQQQALADVQGRGFLFPPLPQNQSYRGVLPVSVTDLDDKNLGDLLNEIAIWASYAEGQLTLAKQARNEAEAKLEFTKSRIRIGLKASEDTRKLSNPDKDDIVNTDPRVLEAQRVYLYCEAVYDYTKHLVTASQRDWETVSRRITQRGQEVDRMGRTQGAGSVPVMSSAFRSR